MSPNERRAWTAGLWAVGVLLVAGASAGAGWWAMHSSDPAAVGPDGRARAAGASVGESAAPVRATLPTGRDYYVLVKLVEVAPERPGGGKWDRAGYAAPDLTYNVIWQGQTVFSSGVRDDTLIGSWDLLGVDLKDVLKSGGTVEAEGLLKAPIVRVEPGTTFDVEVWDKDAMASDLAGRVTVRPEELFSGDNTIRPTINGANAVKRIVVQLIDRRTPVPELLETLSAR